MWVIIFGQEFYVFNGHAYLCVCGCEVVDQVPLAVDVEVVAHPALVHQPLHTVLITVLLHTSFVDLQKVEDRHQIMYFYILQSKA